MDGRAERAQGLEATDLLLDERQMLVDLHVVVFAAGYLGDPLPPVPRPGRLDVRGPARLFGRF